MPKVTYDSKAYTSPEWVVIVEDTHYNKEVVVGYQHNYVEYHNKPLMLLLLGGRV